MNTEQQVFYGAAQLIEENSYMFSCSALRVSAIQNLEHLCPTIYGRNS